MGDKEVEKAAKEDKSSLLPGKAVFTAKVIVTKSYSSTFETVGARLASVSHIIALFKPAYKNVWTINLPAPWKVSLLSLT